MSHVRASYELRRYTSVTDPDFQDALNLYVRLIPGPLRTSSNEIIHWLEQYGEHAPDQFCICGLYSNKRIVGYSQFAYFKRERTIAFDYILLHEDSRNHGEYFQFAKMLRQWIDECHWEIDYIVAEVGFDSSAPRSEHGATLIDLFLLLGFSVADCIYYQPQLGLDNAQSDIGAHFLIRPSARAASISAAVYLKLVETVYFRHYERWYQPFLHDPKKYAQILKNRFDEIKKVAEQRQSIELNGIKDCPPPSPHPPPARSRRNRSYLQSVAVAMMVLTICFCLLLFQRIFDRETTVVLTYLAASLLVSAAAFALYFKRGPWLLKELMDFFKSFHKRK